MLWSAFKGPDLSLDPAGDALARRESKLVIEMLSSLRPWLSSGPGPGGSARDALYCDVALLGDE